LCERSVFWWLLAAVLVLAGYHVIESLDLSLDNREGAMMLVTERMTHGLPSPEWIAKTPYTLSPYGPVYFVLNEVVSSIGPWRRTLIPGRLVSAFAGLLTAGLIGLVVGRRTHSAELGLASAVIYLRYPETAAWIHCYRVDALAVLFALAAYAAPGLPRRGLAISAVMVVAGSLVKQTVALAAVPIVLHLIIERRSREAALYTLGVLTLAGVGWGILYYGSGGYYADLSPLSIHRRYHAGGAILLSVRFFFGKPVTVAAILSVLGAAVADPACVVRCRYVIAGAFASGVAAVLSGTEGAWSNYYLEPAALASALLGLYGINALWRMSRGWTSVLLWAASLATIVGTTGNALKSIQSQERPPDLTSVLGKVKSPYILADGAYIALVASVGLEPAVNDTFFYSILVRNRIIDAGRLADDMRAGRVGGLVLRRPREAYAGVWPVEIVAAMKSHYTSVDLAFNKQIYIYLYISSDADRQPGPQKPGRSAAAGLQSACPLPLETWVSGNPNTTPKGNGSSIQGIARIHAQF